RRQVRVSRATVPYPMRAIGRYALQMTRIRPSARPPNFIQQRIRALEFPRDRNRRMDKHSSQVLQRRLARKSCDLDVLKSMVRKSRMPCFLPVPFQDIGVGLKLLICIELKNMLL